mgnify:CR=1 FL=1
MQFNVLSLETFKSRARINALAPDNLQVYEEKKKPQAIGNTNKP